MPRTKEQNKEIREKTKEAILNASLKLFAERGFHATSMSDIANVAGVSKGLAYNYFDSKQHIVEAIFQNVLELFEHEYLPVLTEPDPYLKLDKLTDITFEWLQKSIDFWKMLFAFWLQPEIIKKSTEFTNKFYHDIFLVIENIFKEIGISNYVAEARIYGALLDGIAFDYFVDIKNYPLQDVIYTIKKRYSRESLLLLKENKI